MTRSTWLHRAAGPQPVKQREREWRKRRVQELLTTALFVLEHDPEISLIQTMLAVVEFAGWLNFDRVVRTVRELTIKDETPP